MSKESHGRMLVGIAYISSPSPITLFKSSGRKVSWKIMGGAAAALFTLQLNRATGFGLLPIAQELPSLRCCFHCRASWRMQVAQLF
jgi:hypothetical protein